MYKQNHLNLRTLLPGLVLFIFFVFGFTDQESSSIFLDDFETYATTSLIKRAYASWENGARLEISLEETEVDGGLRSMRIDALGPNSLDDSKTGSIFRSLPLLQRNWSDASGIRFWISNPVNKDLWLTVNFKEAYNEYWSVRHGSEYFLKAVNSTTKQGECLYGNLLIPANFTGQVIIPMVSFSVPEWNTARGDEKLQLDAIESYALGITLNEDYPRTFYIDSFEVFSTQVPFSFISGVRSIQIPDSGKIIETFTVKSSELKLGPESLAWSVESDLNPDISIDSDGNLTVPSNSKDEVISIILTIGKTDVQKIGLPVRIYHLHESADQEKYPGSERGPSALSIPPTEYDLMAQRFETWAREYRPIFVLMSVGFVLLFIFILSTFQRKLK